MEATATEKKVPARKPATLKDATFERNCWQIAVDPGTALADVLKPDFWAHVGRSLKPCDHIEVIAEDFSWFAELIVLEADRTWAKVAALRFVELQGQSVQTPDAEYEITFKGPDKKHCVVRKSDKKIMVQGIALKVDAETWIREHQKTLAR
jgi:hypothetical protein